MNAIPKSMTCTSVPIDLPNGATVGISGALNELLADSFALYVKTKNVHWHVFGPHLRDYHVLMDELRSIPHIARLQFLVDNEKTLAETIEMLTELLEDNRKLAVHMRKAQRVCDELCAVNSSE
jgi:starvation-inducible DNA-binding protein